MNRRREIAAFCLLILGCIAGVIYEKYRDTHNQLFSLSVPESGTLVTSTPGARCERGNLITGARGTSSVPQVRYTCSAPLSWPLVVRFANIDECRARFMRPDRDPLVIGDTHFEALDNDPCLHGWEVRIDN